MSDIISIKGLEKTYVTSGEQLTILKNLDWNLPSGVKAVITGASGSGKSTFLNILSGIDSATGGSIHVGPYLISEMDEDCLAEYRSSFLGLIFQFHYLLKDFTALENVFMPKRSQSAAAEPRKQKKRLVCF